MNIETELPHDSYHHTSWMPSSATPQFLDKLERSLQSQCLKNSRGPSVLSKDVIFTIVTITILISSAAAYYNTSILIIFISL